MPRNPYDFVPFEGSPRRDFRASGQHTMREGITGEIICDLRVMTPLFIGTGQRDEDDRKATLHRAMADDQPTIPASALKGMLRSVVEAASDSCMGVLSDAYPGIGPMSEGRRIPRGYASCRSLEHLCPACALFGMVEGDNEQPDETKKALAGRIIIGAAIAGDWHERQVILPGRRQRLGTIAPIGSPKPAHAPFYFDRQGQSLGRKFYYRTESWQDTLQQYRVTFQRAFGTNYRGVVLEAIAEESQFSFPVRFMSLSTQELDWLLYGLFLESTMCHHLGYGKPFGLGSVRITPQPSSGIRVLQMTGEKHWPAIYLNYDTTRADGQAAGWQQLPRTEADYTGSAWDRPNAALAHAKLAEILHWPRQEVFFYPDFRNVASLASVSLADYQAGNWSPEGQPAVNRPREGEREEGEVLFFTPQTSSGRIRGPDDRIRRFSLDDVINNVAPSRGQRVVYTPADNRNWGPIATRIELLPQGGRP